MASAESGIRSHAQNREDLVLAGMLKGVRGGFYVDVGANHPEFDSVTKLFYDAGWSGLNLEPNAACHELLQAQRPRDVNLCVGVAAHPGTLRLRVYDTLNGLSTFDRRLQALHAVERADAPWRDVDVPVARLADLLAEHRPRGDIHFLKIDVEGLEVEVLLGNDWRRFRPWVVCLERNLDRARNAAAAALLRGADYERLFDDGINEHWGALERGPLTRQFDYAGDVVLGGALRELRAQTPAPGQAPAPAAGPVGDRDVAALLALETAQFVDAAYQAILGRDADPAGRAHYLEALAGPMSRPAFLRVLASSAEARERGLGTDWLALLPDPEPAPPEPRDLLSRLLSRGKLPP